jgi:hypothetical protein
VTTEAKQVAHTPGPWHVFDGQNTTKIFKRGRTVCAYPQGEKKWGSMAVAYCDYHTSELAEANASLIAAAPDLLELARLFQASVEYEIKKSRAAGDEEGARLKTITLNMIRAALSKAGAA